MLFTDSDLITAASLVALDSEVTAAGVVEGVTMADSIRAAWEECAHEITAKMQSYGGGTFSSLGVGTAHIAAVMNTGAGIGGTSISQPRARLSNVCTAAGQYPNSTPQILRWVQYNALYLFFRDASNRVVTQQKQADRYGQKKDQYNAERSIAWNRLEANGLPAVYAPLACPGALHEPNQGTWAAANIVSGVGASPFASMDIQITWTGAAYLSATQNGNAESAGSTKLTTTIGTANSTTVDITSLVPAAGTYATQGYADGLTSGMAATGWNVYTANTGSPLRLQNSTPIPIATKTFTLPGSFVAGAYLGDGQWPDRNIAFIRSFNRA